MLHYSHICLRIVIYISSQFENSLGKLQAVTVKAPRQIIDVGVVSLSAFSSLVEPSVDLSKPPAQSFISRCAALIARSLMATVLHLGQNPRELEPTTNRFFKDICDSAPPKLFSSGVDPDRGSLPGAAQPGERSAEVARPAHRSSTQGTGIYSDTAYCTISTPIIS